MDEIKTWGDTPNQNPRYRIFCDNFGCGHKNWVYVDFISKMKILYVGCIYAPIFDHDEFTAFIKDNSTMYRGLDDASTTMQETRI